MLPGYTVENHPAYRQTLCWYDLKRLEQAERGTYALTREKEPLKKDPLKNEYVYLLYVSHQGKLYEKRFYDDPANITTQATDDLPQETYLNIDFFIGNGIDRHHKVKVNSELTIKLKKPLRKLTKGVTNLVDTLNADIKYIDNRKEIEGWDKGHIIRAIAIITRYLTLLKQDEAFFKSAARLDLVKQIFDEINPTNRNTLQLPNLTFWSKNNNPNTLNDRVLSL